MTERKWRWVARDKDDPRWVNVFMRAEKPKRCHFNYWVQPGNDSATDIALCARGFKAATGLTVPTDRPIRVEFTARVLEDDE